jgi:hypothetical protein
MNDQPELSPEAEQRLDRAVAAYASTVRAPGPSFDEAVMTRIRSAPANAGPGVWRWLFAPQRLSIRPIVLALAASLALLLVWPSRPGNLGPMAPGTVLVRFELMAPGASSVALAGSFNSWSSAAITLVPSATPGMWTVTLPLALGSHEYMFVVDGQRWIADPTAHAQVDDGFGQTNSVIVVGPRGVVKS